MYSAVGHQSQDSLGPSPAQLQPAPTPEPKGPGARDWDLAPPAIGSVLTLCPLGPQWVDTSSGPPSQQPKTPGPSSGPLISPASGWVPASGPCGSGPTHQMQNYHGPVAVLLIKNQKRKKKKKESGPPSSKPATKVGFLQLCSQSHQDLALPSRDQPKPDQGPATPASVPTIGSQSQGQNPRSPHRRHL